MNRATFLKSLAGGAIALPAVALADSTSEHAIYDLIDAVVDAKFSHDFSRLSSMMHPESLRMFRMHHSACYDRLLTACSPEQIAAVSGLTMHPKDIPGADAAFFVSACSQAKERHPEFVGDQKFLPLRIHGCIFDDEHLAHVLYSYKGSVHTEKTALRYVAPNVLSVRRDKGPWQVYSCILADSITRHWAHDLFTNLRGDPVALGRLLDMPAP